MRDISLLETKDGSFTLESEQYNATYHSIFGALEESIHVFIAAGLYHQIRSSKTPIRIFEMGFGTGLNAWLSAIEGFKHQIPIEYTTVEMHPIKKDVYSKLSFEPLIQSDIPIDFQNFHEVAWNTLLTLSPLFSFCKYELDIQQLLDREQFNNSYDVIYFDAFAPSCQAHLWEDNIHQQLFNALAPGGCLVTYCAQGRFKRMLKSIGYQLDPLNGPARKHEMTRAIKL